MSSTINLTSNENEGLQIGSMSKYKEPVNAGIKTRIKTVSFDDSFPDMQNNGSKWYKELLLLDLITTNFLDVDIETHRYEAVYFYNDITFVKSRSNMSSLLKTSDYYGKVVVIPNNVEDTVKFIKSYVW